MYSPTQRLMRSRTDKIVSGVAGGIARYLAVDPVFVRLAFVALGLSGVGVLLYPILWLVMPLEPESVVGTPGTYAGSATYAARPDNVRQAHFDSMTGQPLNEGEEIPIGNIGGPVADTDVQARRNRILGIILVSIGAMVVVNMFDASLGRFIVPTILIAAGILLLRRK